MYKILRSTRITTDMQELYSGANPQKYIKRHRNFFWLGIKKMWRCDTHKFKKYNQTLTDIRLHQKSNNI